MPWGCAVFRGNDYGIHAFVTGHDTDDGTVFGRSEDRSQRRFHVHFDREICAASSPARIYTEYVVWQKVMPGISVIGLALIVGGVIALQGANFFKSGAVIFIAVLLHNSLGYALGYGVGKLTGMNTAKKRTISIEVGMQNAGLATNLATAHFAAAPQAAMARAVSCVWHSISGTILAGIYLQKDNMQEEQVKNREAAETE